MNSIELRFRFFGSFALRAGDEWCSGPAPKKGGQLIQYLGAYPRRVATREEIAEAFWPEADVESVGHRIHLAASGAREFLRNAFGLRDGIECVTGGYAWNPCVHVTSDAEELLVLCRRGDLDQLDAAAGLYAGEFLAGDAADWIQPLRVRCASAFGSALDRLADDAFRRGEYAAALSYGLQLVEAEQGHEGATRLVMRCFTAVGQPLRALERFEALDAYLRQHLGIGPTPETSALAAELRAGSTPQAVCR